MTTTAFISGHTDLTEEELAKHYVPLLKKAVKRGDKFVTAAAFGADRMVIDWLIKNKVPKKLITIYLHDSYRDREEGYLDEGYRVSTGYKTHLERDEAMTLASDYDIAWLRPDEEARAMYGPDWEKGGMSATEKNILRRKVAQAAEQYVQKQVATIKNVLPMGSSTLSCNGTYKTSQPVEIYYKGKNYSNDGSIYAVKTPIEDAESMKSLVEACKTATFGIGKEEVTDESYRKAAKLDTDAFATSFQLCDTEILRIVHRVLAPTADSIRAELYKLNIYEVGGFFKAHKDTPRGSGMFGSLVICLDQPFEGGELVVQHKERKIVYGNAVKPGNLNWMAFFSDCTHEVLPVTYGNRITLTYNLYRQSDSTVQNVPPTISHELFDTIDNLIKEGTMRGKILGFALEHVYVQGSTTFKGNDLLLMNTLQALEKKYPTVKAKPYLQPNVETSYDEDGDSVSEGDEELFIDWGDFQNGDELYDRSADADYFEESYGAEGYNVTWVNEPRNTQYTDTVAAYGNSPTTEDLYCAGCVLFFIEG